MLGLFVLIRTFLSLSLQLEDSSGQSRPAVNQTGSLRIERLSFFGLFPAPISYVVIMWITEKIRGPVQPALIEQLSFQQTQASSRLDPAQPLQ